MSNREGSNIPPHATQPSPTKLIDERSAQSCDNLLPNLSSNKQIPENVQGAVNSFAQSPLHIDQSTVVSRDDNHISAVHQPISTSQEHTTAHRACDNASIPRHDIIPLTLNEALSVIKQCNQDYHTAKSIIKVVKITGISNTKLDTKMRAIGTKMVQRSLSVNNLITLTKNTEDDLVPVSQAGRISLNFPTTMVRIIKKRMASMTSSG